MRLYIYICVFLADYTASGIFSLAVHFAHLIVFGAVSLDPFTSV